MRSKAIPVFLAGLLAAGCGVREGGDLATGDTLPTAPSVTAPAGAIAVPPADLSSAASPSADASGSQDATPSATPTPAPTAAPTAAPTTAPTAAPTAQPT
ncbi:MAG: hypothetical protein FJZ01_11270, partial [Candidatus Sericytochromatia bacterium]|nr:hypothetical protein [Candidatus Tanganyikabacteria bacterium]